MGRISIANLKKTVYYLKRNGLRDTYLAALERLQEKTEEKGFEPVSDAEAEGQRKKQWAEGFSCKISIVVPTYRTPAEFLHAMIDSVLEQTYADFELVLADASGDDSVKCEVDKYTDERIVYLKLEKNGGISDNTNEGLKVATGDYIGLLDHDDVLTRNALFEMASELEKAYIEQRKVSVLYSDEDKCDETGVRFYEAHNKKEFNLDLILSNNYICHFLVMQNTLMKKVGFRKEFDGAQDFDLVLQAVAELMETDDRWEKSIVHIPKVLYHWRCHSGSTAVNPASKMYAYEAGGRAIGAFLERMGWDGKTEPLKHLGFYRINYRPDVLSVRKDIGVVGGPVYKRNKITGATYERDGAEPYKGNRKGFSGYMHRAALQQEAYAVDIRNVKVREELQALYEEVTGIAYVPEDTKNKSVFKTEKDWKKLSLAFGEEVRKRGYTIVWDPNM